jgi:glycosyltransferase involved in cell wall biosynthesis
MGTTVTKHAVLLTLDYPPSTGGIARLLHAWTTDGDDFEWRVITTASGPESSDVTRTSLKGLVLAALVGSRSWLMGADERYVVAGHAYLSGLAVAVALTTGARSGCVTHGRELTPRKTRLRIALCPLRLVHRVVAVSDNTAARAINAGARRSTIRVVRPLLRAPWMAEEAPARPQGTGLRVVTVTRLQEGYKNLELLMRIAAVLHPLRIVEQLVVIGGGPRLDRLKEKASELGVTDAIAFTGHLPDSEIGGLLTACHLGLFASRDSIAESGFEGFGLVVHELAAAGIPVLVGAAAGAIDAATHPWALLLNPDDLWAWVSAIEDLYAHEDRRFAMGATALAWAQSIVSANSARSFTAAISSPPTPACGAT